MQDLNGILPIIVFSACVALVLVVSGLIYFRQRKRRRLDYLSFQLDKQNKNFHLTDGWEDGVTQVRIRSTTEEKDTSLLNAEAKEENEEVYSMNAPTVQASWPKVISLYIKAKPHENFYGYDLMQSILNQGLIHGAMDFFHFITGHRTLFSLTSTEAPGNFNLNGMGGFKTSGLCLFLQPHRFQQPAIIFDKMVTVGQQIADDLGGVLEDEYHHLLTPERLNYWKAELGQTSE